MVPACKPFHEHIYDLSKVWLSQIYFCSWSKAVFIRSPTKRKEFCVWIVGGLTNERPTSDKVVTMLINARHWTRRALLMWWTPKWLCEKTRSKTQSNLCYDIVLLVFLTIYQNIVQAKCLIPFSSLSWCFSIKVFSQDCFETPLKVFQTPKYFRPFCFENTSNQIKVLTEIFSPDLRIWWAVHNILTSAHFEYYDEETWPIKKE